VEVTRGATLATGAASVTGAGAALIVGRLEEYDSAGAGAATVTDGAAEITAGAAVMVAGVVCAGEVRAANDIVELCHRRCTTKSTKYSQWRVERNPVKSPFSNKTLTDSTLLDVFSNANFTNLVTSPLSRPQQKADTRCRVLYPRDELCVNL